MFENKNICSLCGGACCKSKPGLYYPSDKADLNTLEIEWLNIYGTPTPSPKRKRNGHCIYFEDGHGCQAPIKPYQCKVMQPEIKERGKGKKKKTFFACSTNANFKASDKEISEAWQILTGKC